MKTCFSYGDLAAIAREVGLPSQRICDYLSGRLAPSFDRAVLIVKAAKKREIETKVWDWLMPHMAESEIIRNYREAHGYENRKPSAVPDN